MTATARDTRAEILQVALELFSVQGYDGVPLSEIAERMGFSKAALYYHFKSKEQLAAALLNPLFADIDRVLEAHEGRGDTQAARRRLLGAYADVIISHRAIVRFAYADLSVLNQADLGGRAQQQGARLAGLLAPTTSGLAGTVRATVAVTGLQLAIAALGSEDPVIVRAAAVDAALGALGRVSRGG